VITAILVVTMFFSASSISSCKKNSTGGDATIAASAKHHERTIPYSVIYIKYGAKEFPGNDVSKYDNSQKTDRHGHTHFENIRPGNYYLYGVGYDSAIMHHVTGGVPVIIKW
jgi:hypothetical protein